MFTGFASENTPAIQVWDFFRTFASSSADRSVSLADDCAPIQFFRTGATTNAIRVYLPSAPIEGKQIKIVNQSYGNSNQFLQIRTADNGGNGTTGIAFTVGPGASITIVYCKNSINSGVATGNNQTGWLSLSFGSPTAGNFNAVVLGNPSNIANTNSASVVGGISNTASGSSSFVAGGSSNQASNTNAVVVGGSGNTASGDRSAVVGGTSGTASQYASSVVGGDTNTASSTHSVVIGGQNNIANSINSAVVGGRRSTTRAITSNFVTSASNAPIADSIGVQQLATLLLGRQTTNATATVLTCDINVGGTTNQVILPNNSAYTFQGTCIAARTAAGDTSSWKFEGAIKRGANAASTVLVAAVTPTVIAQDAGASTWVLAITADTTNGGIAVTVTGQAATTIRWVVKIETTEVTF